MAGVELPSNFLTGQTFLQAGLSLPGFLPYLYFSWKYLGESPNKSDSSCSHQNPPAMKININKEQNRVNLCCREDGSESLSLAGTLSVFATQLRHLLMCKRVLHYAWCSAAAGNVPLNTCAGADNCGNNVLVVIYLLN